MGRRGDPVRSFELCGVHLPDLVCRDPWVLWAIQVLVARLERVSLHRGAVHTVCGLLIKRCRRTRRTPRSTGSERCRSRRGGCCIIQAPLAQSAKSLECGLINRVVLHSGEIQVALSMEKHRQVNRPASPHPKSSSAASAARFSRSRCRASIRTAFVCSALQQHKTPNAWSQNLWLLLCPDGHITRLPAFSNTSAVFCSTLSRLHWLNHTRPIPT